MDNTTNPQNRHPTQAIAGAVFSTGALFYLLFTVFKFLSFAHENSGGDIIQLVIEFMDSRKYTKWIVVIIIIFYQTEKVIGDIKKKNDDIIEIIGSIRYLIGAIYDVSYYILSYMFVFIRVLLKIIAAPIITPIKMIWYGAVILLEFIIHFAFWLRTRPIGKVAIVAAVLNIVTPGFSATRTTIDLSNNQRNHSQQIVTRRDEREFSECQDGIVITNNRNQTEIKANKTRIIAKLLNNISKKSNVSSYKRKNRKNSRSFIDKQGRLFQFKK